jgi:hypothetical protein
MGQASLNLRAVIMPCRANPTPHRKSQCTAPQIKRRPTANKSLCWFVSENFSEISQETLRIGGRFRA